MNSPFDIFLEPEAQRINLARLEHLANLGLDLDRKRVLEVGAGIGLRTAFFEDRGCDVLSTDGAPSNLAEMLRRWPHRRLGLLDLDQPMDLQGLGTFDIVYCYDTLHQLRDPDRALARLAAICNGIILLETVVSRGSHSELNPVVEPPAADQAVSGVGCRPTRPWILSALRRHFGHAYTTVEQPQHPDFVTDWSLIDHSGNLRAVFVGARTQLASPALTERLPVRHNNAPPRSRRAPMQHVWIVVGADRGGHSRAAAQCGPEVTVHAFEPLPAPSTGPAGNAPNYHVHAMAVGEQDGMAAFHINSFDAASSLVPLDEAAQARRKDADPPRLVRVIQLPVTRLDSFMQWQAIHRVEFLKIEAQGGDLAVLRSAGDRLADIDRVQLALTVAPGQPHPGSADKAAVLAYMAARRFHLTETQSQSDGQQETLTFERTDAGADRQIEPTAAADQGEQVTGLFDFTEAKLGYGEIQLIGDVLEVVTDPQQWAYAAVVPIGASFREAHNNRYEVELAVQVDAGVLQIGILNQAEDDFPSAAAVAKSSGWQNIILVTPPLASSGPLVIRNAADSGSSRARCRILAVTALAAPRVADSTSRATQEEAQALAEQIQAAAEALAPMTSESADLATAVAPAVADAVLRLRRVVARGGQGLISADADALAAVFASLTTGHLAQLAAALAVPASLHTLPGWRMDSFLESGELATFVRYAIWLTLCRRADAGPIVLPWHAGTRLGMNFCNDLGLAVFVGADFEPNAFALLGALLQPGMTVLDGGANEGAYTLLMAALVGPEGRVIAVEPSPRERERLQANVALNGMPQVAVIGAALADQPGEIDLLLAEAAHAGQNTLGSFIYSGVASAGSVRVPATTLDRLADTQDLAGLDIIKLDLEGAELRSLTGAQETLRRWRPLVLFECAQSALARQGGSVEEIMTLFDNCGYRILSFDPLTGKPVPLAGNSASDNLIAVHRERDWGLRAG